MLLTLAYFAQESVALGKELATTTVGPALDPTVLVAFIVTIPPTVSALFAARQASKTPAALTESISLLANQLTEHTAQDDRNFRDLEVNQARMEGQLEEALKRG